MPQGQQHRTIWTQRRKREAAMRRTEERWARRSGEVTTREPTPEERERYGMKDQLPAFGGSSTKDKNPNQPTDRQVYFADRLGLTIPAVVKLNKSWGRPYVLAAMEQLHGFPPEEPVENPYAYLATVASMKAAGLT